MLTGGFRQHKCGGGIHKHHNIEFLEQKFYQHNYISREELRSSAICSKKGLHTTFKDQFSNTLSGYDPLDVTGHTSSST